MDTMFPLKEIGRIGKGLLVQMVGLCQNYKKEMFVEEIDFDSCPDVCPFKRFDIEKKREICMNHCPHNRKMKTPKVVYVNERHKYNIKVVEKTENRRLSKYQILQLLTYHFLGIDSRGFVPFVSAKELSKKIGCTVRTIKNNNQRLVELGFIALTRYNSDLFSVSIIGYDKIHLTREQGGTGYVQMTKEFLEALYDLDNVNSIRLAIRQLLKYDDEVEVKKGEQCVYTYNDIKRFMPSNVNHKKVIDQLMQKTTKLFEIEAKDSFVLIKLKDEFNGKIQKHQKEKEFTQVIEQYIKEQNENLYEEEIKDLAQLSMEYGIDMVLEGISFYIQYKNSDRTPDFVDNIGGFIRTVIRNNFLKKWVA